MSAMNKAWLGKGSQNLIPNRQRSFGRNAFNLIFGFCLISSTLSQSEPIIRGSSTAVPQRLTKDKPIVVNTCCDIDLSSKEPVQCAKPAPGDDIKPSKSIVIPPHLMAENATTELKLKKQKAQCLPSDLNTVYLSWASVSSESARTTLFLKNGYLKVQREFYHMDEYCINGKNQTTLEVKICPQDCKGSRPCIFKCCGLDKLYSFGLPRDSKIKGCVDPVGVGYQPSMYVDFVTQIDPDGVLAPHYIEKYPTSFKSECPNQKYVGLVVPKAHEIMVNSTLFGAGGPPMSQPFRLKADGTILYQDTDGGCKDLDPRTTHACIDGIINYGETHPFANSHDEQFIVVCVKPEEPNDNREVGSYIYGGLMIFSCVFLLLTVIVYLLLWERQNVHGWTILSHTISLFFMYLFLGVSHIVGVTVFHKSLNTTWCFTLGLLIHYWFLATFCWLTMISVDLWLTFRAITPRSGRKSKGLSRYLKYSVAGWGVPFIIVLVGWILSTEHPSDSCIISKVLTPAYGTENCYIQAKALGVYLYYPIAVKLGINLTFFIITTIKLFMYRDSTKMATKDDQNQQFYRLFFKLFFVIGVPYLFEVISWAVSGSGLHGYWVVFDVLNILRAVAVFIIFVCKADILWALEQKYPKLKPVLKIFACILREKREFARRQADSEFVGLNSSMSRSTKQSTLRSSSSAAI